MKGMICAAHKDDGIGFNLKTGRKGRVGLMSVRERIQNIGGIFDLISSDGGTKAKMTLKLSR